MALILVDCEGHGPAPGPLHDPVLFEFGAVEFKTRKTFHGQRASTETFQAFERWLAQWPGRPIFVSDNPAYDWQYINYYFHALLGRNPFGHSARRISDFYAGLVGNWYQTQEWKEFRKTPHDHNPVNDAMGNAEALERLFEMARMANSGETHPLDRGAISPP